MFSWLPKTVKQSVKGKWKKLRLAYVRRKYAFGKEELKSLLRSLGLDRGDAVLVHSSLDQFEGFTGKPTDIIAALQEVLGEEGTLLMPTLPFTGTAVEYVSRAGTFDVARTASRMGLITELFRRSPGVRRSVHPTHAVAAWGSKAEQMIADHHLAGTPCGRQTPYGRLLDFDGKILLLGTDIGAMTFFHTMEEELEPSMPFSPFTREIFSLQSRDMQGNPLVTRTRLFDPVHSRRRNLFKLVPVLQQTGWWKEGRVGKLRAILLRAKEVAEATRTLARRGEYGYDS